jgi:meiotically up-regulated gene 157 (Mug157) protein
LNTLKTFDGFEKWVRPTPENRAFYSSELDDYLGEISQEISNVEIRQLFINTFANTLDTTAYNYLRNGKHHTYIITGDIEAMWLRDSTAQVWHYLPLAKTSAEIDRLLVGLIGNQARCILMDPYTNAFYDEEKLGVHATDMTQMSPGVHERKWELDSLIYPIALATTYWKITQNSQPFDGQWCDSISLILATLKVQQRVHGHGPYFFDRVTSNPIDTLSNQGHGSSYKQTGMVASSFRASDDSCTYPFNIPENLFALKTLKDLLELLSDLKLSQFVAPINELIGNISSGIEKYAHIDHPVFGKIYAFEVDGLGNTVSMDDANVPSLLSLPYLGVIAVDDEIYRATRAFILSKANPYYFSGSLGSGIGSPHTGNNSIWPISLIIQASTSTNEEEILSCLRVLIKSSAGTGLLHESFNADNASDYTRAWFAWCNSLFGGLIVQLVQERPGLLQLI